MSTSDHKGKVQLKNICLSKLNVSSCFPLFCCSPPILFRIKCYIFAPVRSQAGPVRECTPCSRFLSETIKHTFFLGTWIAGRQLGSVSLPLVWKKQCCSKGLCDRTLRTQRLLIFLVLLPWQISWEKNRSIKNYRHWFIKSCVKGSSSNSLSSSVKTKFATDFKLKWRILKVQIKVTNQIRTLFQSSSSVSKDMIFGDTEICQGTKITYLVGGFTDLRLIWCRTGPQVYFCM